LLCIWRTCYSRTSLGRPSRMNSCSRHCEMLSRYSGDHRTIFYTRSSMAAGALFNLSRSDILGCLPCQLEKSNSLARSHF
jgi:hypothetical protein